MASAIDEIFGYPRSRTVARAEPGDDLLSYPRSRASAGSDIVRSTTWHEDITKLWNVPITGLETLEERADRYMIYFSLTPDQLKHLNEQFQAEIKRGLELHRDCPRGMWETSKCSLKMIDTWVPEKLIPKGFEKGYAYAMDFAGDDVGHARCVKVQLDGANKISLPASTNLELRIGTAECPKGILDRKATASMLFDTLASAVQKLKEVTKNGAPKNGEIPAGFSVSFPMAQRAIDSAALVHWTKGFETGRESDDPVEGMDMAALLNCALDRLKLGAKIRAIMNDATGTLLTCRYEEPSGPPCKVGFVVGSGVNGCYITPESKREYGYTGAIISCEVGGFDKSLPNNDVDLEVDFADVTTKGIQLLEKMVSTTYLGEVCRRLIVKVWQSEAPPLAWVRYSMPWLACGRVIADVNDPELKDTDSILNGLWDWETSLEQRQLVQQLFQVVFDRSAALTAVCIVALASQTERLQPAMGGLTCAIGGSLCSKIPTYLPKVQEYIHDILDADLAKLLRLHQVEDAAAKGAGILACKVASEGHE